MFHFGNHKHSFDLWPSKIIQNYKKIQLNYKFYQNDTLFFCSSTVVRNYIDTMKMTFDLIFDLYQADNQSRL